ncbi:sulfite reductase (NADPH) flavoprotein alpha-component [Luteibacter rhizovicinus]|uniref:NADPH--hemoprotein reductase n=1 Tax=Luteibacter rhizovicinus TaxID=242606 RepID=A0A4R3YW69_9GAMM|nr:sulfite reductase subunit alpha [Luteibacter rhizovicinus]TCV95664.1 sulfite reductase (NADPH) flavoprotein alpha-component [Luteibacter rhizovicinus]
MTASRRALLGQCLIGVCLIAVAIMLWRWHRASLFSASGDSQRLGWAIAITLIWTAGSVALAVGRRRERVSASRVIDVAVATPVAERILVVHASQTGFAEELAMRTAEALRDTGIPVDTRTIGQLDASTLAGHARVLFVVSTTGEGDAPDSAVGFQRAAMSAPLALGHLSYGVLALGDRDYDDFCAFGYHLEHWLHASGALPLFDLVEVDNGDEGALRHWQHHIGQLSGNTEMPDWQRPSYQAWRLTERRLLNAGSLGEACFHVALVPGDASWLQWNAGDIVEIGPRHGAADIARWTEEAELVADSALTNLLAGMHLPVPDKVRGCSPDVWLPTLAALPHREYSIASLPSDGALHLVVRRQRGPDGALGVGSGWLTHHAAVGAEIDVRVRRNAGFHAPADDRPVVLIGNGTGIAGLRALLKQRIASGHRRNWLVFGERQAAVDRLHVDELEAWRASRDIERLDLVWSRDGGSLRYVQDALCAAGDDLRRWVADGASVYVCGSLAGMAPGVDTALRSVLGDVRVEELAAAGRYRRDVY